MKVLNLLEGDYTCNKCDTRGSLLKITNHDCAHENYVTESGGRCEDFPACGHTDGNTCRYDETGDSAFWLLQFELAEARGDYDYDFNYD